MHSTSCYHANGNLNNYYVVLDPHRGNETVRWTLCRCGAADFSRWSFESHLRPGPFPVPLCLISDLHQTWRFSSPLSHDLVCSEILFFSGQDPQNHRRRRRPFRVCQHVWTVSYPTTPMVTGATTTGTATPASDTRLSDTSHPGVLSPPPVGPVLTIPPHWASPTSSCSQNP